MIFIFSAVIIPIFNFFIFQDLELAWWPLMRDGLCYALSLIILAIVIVDGKVGW